ncbi:hypothetical protein F4806DRAFT_96200 [Annulohypoxylon nitens]|nr:hypothetical protein F4806DRAFT_96200 [Annulohypoxylon nitens]
MDYRCTRYSVPTFSRYTFDFRPSKLLIFNILLGLLSALISYATFIQQHALRIGYVVFHCIHDPSAQSHSELLFDMHPSSDLQTFDLLMVVIAFLNSSMTKFNIKVHIGETQIRRLT